MSTPRTDRNERIVLGGVGGDWKVVTSDFARQLENELIAATALADRLAEALGNLKIEVANTLWTSRNGTEMAPGTAESIREEVNEAIGNAFAEGQQALADYENHKK